MILKDYKQKPRQIKQGRPSRFGFMQLRALGQAINLLSHHVFGFLILVLFVSILLSLPLTMIYFSQSIQDIGKAINQNAQISLYLTPGISASNTQTLINEIKLRDDARLVKYISPDQGLNEFERQSGIDKLTNYIPNNPIPGVIIIKTASSHPSVANIKQIAGAVSKFSGVDNITVNTHWISSTLDFIQSIYKYLAIATLITFFLIFVIITTLFNLLLPESLKETSKSTMVYLGLLVGIITGIAADYGVNFFSQSIKELTEKLPFITISSEHFHLSTLNIIINQGCSWLVLIIAALIVRHYRILTFR